MSVFFWENLTTFGKKVYFKTNALLEEILKKKRKKKKKKKILLVLHEKRVFFFFYYYIFFMRKHKNVLILRKNGFWESKKNFYEQNFKTQNLFKNLFS